jgi:lysophospholipase L1-like esterase
LSTNTGVFGYVLDGKYCYAAEGATISQKQVAVTYTHSDTKNWTLPLVETAKFPKTMAKLANGEVLKVVFYGDSITVGANSSEYVNIAPKAESYTNMVGSYISARYPSAQITFKNTAVGGTDSNWGAGRSSGNSAIDTIQSTEDSDHFKVRVLNENPDLLFIAFGMNDQAQSPYDTVDYGTTQSDGSYYDNIRSMIERARAQNPDVEIMLISSMIANPETLFYNKDYEAYQNALLKLSSEFENVGVATVYNTVTSLYANGKRFQDCTGNNVNHPNDFMTRVYAQTVLYSLFGEDYYKAI